MNKATKPNNWSRTTVSLTTASTLAVLFLYILGGLGQIKTYSDPFNSASIKLIILHLFLFASMTGALFRLHTGFLESKKNQSVFLIAIIFISILLAAKTITFPDQRHAVGVSYIMVGDYLRDTHNINIYFMDWSGWVVTTVMYLTSIYSFIIYEVSKKILPNA